MNAFQQACRVEQRAVKLLEPFLSQQSLNGQFVFTDKGRLSKELQKKYGDAFINCRNGKIWSVEIKSEEECKYGNFFLETWSNKSRWTIGWMYTLDADILLYCFLKEGMLFSIDFQRLKQWAFTDKSQKSHEGCLYDYPEKPQNKYKQLNDTWGRCVRICDIEQQIGFRFYRLSPDGEWVLADMPTPTVEQMDQGILF